MMVGPEILGVELLGQAKDRLGVALQLPQSHTDHTQQMGGLPGGLVCRRQSRQDDGVVPGVGILHAVAPGIGGRPPRHVHQPGMALFVLRAGRPDVQSRDERVAYPGSLHPRRRDGCIAAHFAQSRLPECMLELVICTGIIEVPLDQDGSLQADRVQLGNEGKVRLRSLQLVVQIPRTGIAQSPSGLPQHRPCLTPEALGLQILHVLQSGFDPVPLLGTLAVQPPGAGDRCQDREQHRRGARGHQCPMPPRPPPHSQLPRLALGAARLIRQPALDVRRQRAR
ncbi:MAG TPA: hypothetical protein VMG10_30860 [Gemmataceae bacterium]|nr:hypothetical protein [Gemmataceae bacterium]